MYVCVWNVCAHVCKIFGGPKRLLDPSELGVQVVVGCPVWVLAIKLKFFKSSVCS